MKISNTLGETVYSEKAEASGSFSEDIDISDLPKGLYFIELNGKDKRQVKKLIVN